MMLQLSWLLYLITNKIQLASTTFSISTQTEIVLFILLYSFSYINNSPNKPTNPNSAINAPKFKNSRNP